MHYLELTNVNNYNECNLVSYICIIIVAILCIAMYHFITWMCMYGKRYRLIVQ